MEKRMRRQSLLVWMISLFAISMIVSFLLSVMTSTLIKTAQTSLVEMKEVSSGNSEIKGGTGDIHIIGKENGKSYMVDVTEKKGLYLLYEWMLIAVPILIFAFSILLSAWIFYRYKLKTPIHALQAGIAQIEKQDLDFSIPYNSKDELGWLCRAFDTMREKLKDTFISLWMEKEKQTLLTSALAHDLRTPLTVIKGHNDLIALSIKNNTLQLECLEAATVAVDENITRMEKYLDNTRDMQALEEWRLCRGPVTGEMISKQVKGVTAVRNQTKLVVENRMLDELQLDAALIMRVLENLIVNAVEHAKSLVTVTIDKKDGFLVVIVEDDGKGFSPEALRYATTAYYCDDKARTSEHMGLGLTIAKTLTERHGGSLSWGNGKKGAYVKATFKSL